MNLEKDSPRLGISNVEIKNETDSTVILVIETDGSVEGALQNRTVKTKIMLQSSHSYEWVCNGVNYVTAFTKVETEPFYRVLFANVPVRGGYRHTLFSTETMWKVIDIHYMVEYLPPITPAPVSVPVPAPGPARYHTGEFSNWCGTKKWHCCMSAACNDPGCMVGDEQTHHPGGFGVLGTWVCCNKPSAFGQPGCCAGPHPFPYKDA
jgi:hypothetical protein